MKPVTAAVWTVAAILTLSLPSSSCDVDYPIWIPRSANADALYRFTKGDLSGYIDQTGKVVIPPIIPVTADANYAGEFHDGLVEIGVSDGVYFDVTGKKVIDKGFYRGWDFSEGLAVAMEKEGGKWGYINTKGEFAISPRFASWPMGYVRSFEGGFASVEVSGKFGYIDHAGTFVIQPTFLDADDFHDGMARVIVDGPCVYERILEESFGCPDFGALPRGTNAKDVMPPPCKYGFIDRSGKLISNQRYDYALPFAEGLAPVRVGKLWGYIDKTGAIAITPRFDSAASFSDGLGLVSENGLYGYVDRTGTYVIKPTFRRAESFSEGRAVVSDVGTDSWYIDKNGNRAFPGWFAYASPFFKGLAHVKLDSNGGLYWGTFAYIDRNGKTVFKYDR